LQDSIKVQQLKHRYRNSLAEKAAELDSALAAIEFDHPGATATVQQLHEYLHKLAGSAGMYGYDDIASSARSSMVLTNARLGVASESAIRQSINELRHLLEQQSKS